MNIKTLSIPFLLLLSLGLKAETSIIYLGGGGEGKKDNTIFDGNLVGMKTALEVKKWEYTVAFNGGHKDTEAQLKKTFPNAVTRPFTEKIFLNILAETKKKILSNQIKPGEQLLLFIDTHGAQKGNDKTHSISVADQSAIKDYDNLSGNGLVSLDKLQEVIAISEAKGIKLGIIDFSCHSGNTLNLKRDSSKTCIITSTGPNHYGFAGKNSFSDKFINELKSSPHTLETAFLEARKESNDNSYPMISTSQSEGVRSSIYQMISPYLQYQAGNSGKLKDDIIDMAKVCETCRTDTLTRLTKKIENYSKIGIINHEVSKNLVTKLREYENLRKFLVSEHKRIYQPGLTKSESFTSKEIDPLTKKPYYQLKFTWKELVKTDEKKLTAMTNALLSKAKSGNLKDFENYKKATLALKANVLNKRKEIIAQNPNLLKVDQQFISILNKTRDTFTLANEIAQLERKFYDELYKNSRSDKNNACGSMYI